MNGKIKLILDKIAEQGKATFSVEFLMSDFIHHGSQEDSQIIEMDMRKWLIQSQQIFGFKYETDLYNKEYTFTKA
ncbi:hypothetical protein [Flammeovirga kamogawensis]|uniref:Uncharacterized protein n=1 Tax=Flammeovirga kamogawensis TaxID=373891 RepID=A0ABX8H3M2_9BACT|nr:hypothetical protein [Flammeovirga kamogawensis]MBB6460190.1 hypothetical protein [Flammeovirga kamogawensis]QWG10002.1 hypothetical protein KM029_20180 [Flammeovirga kamogawensis]TRX65510.1 hypothetical protein EO216_23610 [Flammeovirga kamogawensis]